MVFAFSLDMYQGICAVQDAFIGGNRPFQSYQGSKFEYEYKDSGPRRSCSEAACPCMNKILELYLSVQMLWILNKTKKYRGKVSSDLCSIVGELCSSFCGRFGHPYLSHIMVCTVVLSL